VSGTSSVTHAYDALGRRVKETRTNPASTTTLYYSDAWQVLEERTSPAKIQYVWTPQYVDGLVLRDKDATSDGTFEERLYVQQDANWNVTSVVSGATGNVLERYVYDPYGKVTYYDAGWTTLSTSSAYGFAYLHQGGRLDSFSGLYHFRNRDLSPALGRWTQNDPMGYRGGDTNLYRNVGNHPIAVLDPLGLTEYQDCLTRSSYYGSAAARHPNNPWLKCASNVSQLVCTLAAASGGQKAKWLYCVNNCIFKKWLVAYDALYPEEGLRAKTKWDASPFPKHKLGPITESWKKANECIGDKCKGEKSRECCVEQVKGEQQGLQDCQKECGKYDEAAWGGIFDAPKTAEVLLGMDVKEYFKFRFGVDLPEFKGDFNDLDARIKYGAELCCPK
jgi:RHS repeat-associated protein